VFFYRHVLLQPVVVSKGTTISYQTLTKNIKKAEKIHDYEIINSRNLFGISSHEPEVKEKKDPLEGLAPTSLDVALVGTVFGDNDEKRAIIFEKGQAAQEMYHVGDSIKGAIIKDILRGKVILGFENKDEILTMSEPKGQTTVTAPVTAVPSLRQQNILRALREQQLSSPATDSGISRTRIIPTRKVPSETGNKATTN
jgi:type II secretory pathway component PulC